MKNDSVVPKSRLLDQETFNLMQKSLPIVCVDLVVLRRGEKQEIEVLLIRRSLKTEIGKWCNIGGRVLKDERLARAIRRQARRELGVSVKVILPWSPNRPLAVVDDPFADPQKHSIALVYPVLITSGRLKTQGPEFSDCRWFAANKLPRNIGFNHRQELRKVLKEISPEML